MDLNGSGLIHVASTKRPAQNSRKLSIPSSHGTSNPLFAMPFSRMYPLSIHFFPEIEFKQARWFKRGWCLQELIAPGRIEFYAADWTDIGTKWSLYRQIEDTTGIPSEILVGPSSLMNSYTIAQKMSWASERDTTRKEDQAYCLLGIFGISMPLLYGEGERAFIRLQEEILKQTEDYSLLLRTDESL